MFLWADFLERIATCHQNYQGSYNEVLRNLSLYPSLLLLYATGILAVVRRRWAAPKAIFERCVTFGAREDQPFILRTNSFEVMPEQAQKVIPGREGQYTPLLNHLYETLKIPLLKYFLNETKYSQAFTYLEVILATSFAQVQQEKEKARCGKASDQCWVPVGRFGWQDQGLGSFVDHVVCEAVSQQQAWPPVAAGLYSGEVEVFLDLAPKVKAAAARRGWW